MTALQSSIRVLSLFELKSFGVASLPPLKDKLEGGSRQNNMICIYLLLKSTKKTVLNVWLLMGGRASNER